MVTGDWPLLAIPLVGIGISRMCGGATAKDEGVQAGIYRSVAADFNPAAVDLSCWFFGQEVFEVIRFGFGCQSWLA